VAGSLWPSEEKEFREQLWQLRLHFTELASFTRLYLLHIISQHDEITVGDLAKEAKKSQPLVSWHLRRLKSSGFVLVEKRGRETFCRINREKLQRFLELYADLLDLSVKNIKNGGK
jgi:DNA-binding transcriptional ArsR family regulator